MIYVTDKIGEVVDLMRKTGTFTISKVGNIYTMTGKNTLVNKEWINIAGNEYKVYDVTSNSFKIETSNEITDGSFKSLAPYYMAGHRLEINNRLLEKDKDSKYKYQKYPLIALKLDIEEVVKGRVHDVSLNIAILELTDKNYIWNKRLENVFKPVLYPLYERLMTEIEKAEFVNLDVPSHKKIDRPYWGFQNSEGNINNIFNDPLDAIELVDLQLKLIDLKC